MISLKDKVIIVTGATSGIGRDLSLQLAKSGSKICICGRDKVKMTSLLNEINVKSSNKVFSGLFDITNDNAVIKFVNDVIKEHGKIDGLINCAGVNSARGLIEEIKTTDLEWMLRVNLIAPFVFQREVFKNMKKEGKGLIVNIISTVSLFTNEGLGSYSASKAGFDMLTKIFRKEARKSGIRVMAVYPGGVNTNFRATAREDYLSSESVAESIIALMCTDEKTAIDELVLRPFIETNYV